MVVRPCERAQEDNVKCWVPPLRGNLLLFSHPAADRWQSHPTYILLGFSAALAPKFPHLSCQFKFEAEILAERASL